MLIHIYIFLYVCLHVFACLRMSTHNISTYLRRYIYIYTPLQLVYESTNVTLSIKSVSLSNLWWFMSVFDFIWPIIYTYVNQYHPISISSTSFPPSPPAPHLFPPTLRTQTTTPGTPNLDVRQVGGPVFSQRKLRFGSVERQWFESSTGSIC